MVDQTDSAPQIRDAVDWHSGIALRFDEGYTKSAAFMERLVVWRELIGRYARPGAPALDAGCGSGVLSFVAAQHMRSVLAFDASPEMIRIAREKQARSGGIENVSFREMRMENLQALEGESFSLVMSSSVLEYLDDFWGAIDALSSLMAPDGALIFSVPNVQSLYRRLERMIFDMTGRPRYLAFVKFCFSHTEIAEGLKARGLTPVDVRYYAAAPLLSRPARAVGRADYADNLIAYVCRKS